MHIQRLLFDARVPQSKLPSRWLTCRRLSEIL